MAPLDEAGEDTLEVVGLDVGKLLFRMDSDDDLPLMVAGPSAMCEFVRPDTVPVVMVHMPTDVLGDDRFSPGVSCCIPLDRQSCVDSHGKEHWDSSVACISDWVGALDHPVGMPLWDGI